MNLLNHYSLLHRVMAEDPQLPDLKPLIARWTGQRIRRLDRYIELCIAGGLGCVAERRLPADTGIYLATRCGAVTTSAAVMQAIIAEGESPKPLHFVNTLGNSAGFYLTQLLGVTGNVVVMSQESFSFEATLMHAWLDLQAGRVACALVGAFDEVALPLDRHAQRLQVERAICFTEGSHWLLLDAQESPPGLSVECPFYTGSAEAMAAWLRLYPQARVQTGFAPTPEERLWLPAGSTSFWERTFAQAEGMVSHGVFSGAALVDLLQSVQRGRGIHLARNGAQAYCAVLVNAPG